MRIALNSTVLCRNIRFLRTKYGLTRKSLAMLCGISSFRLRRMESGRFVTDPDAAPILQLSAVFGVPLDSLLTEDLERKENPPQPDSTQSRKNMSFRGSEATVGTSF